MTRELSCRQARHLASVRRECAVEDRARVEAHLSGCPACRAVSHEFELMDRRLGRLPEPAFAGVVPAFAPARSTAAGRTRNKPAWPKWRQAPPSLPMVAVLVVVAVTTVIWFSLPIQPEIPNSLGAADRNPGANSGLVPAERALPQNPGRWAWPAEGCISQPYSTQHLALDIANTIGTPVHAVGDGQVRFAGRDEDMHGIHVYIQHGGNYGSFYSHLDTVRVETGEWVTRGQVIGTLGQTGLATGPHLHFEMSQDDIRFDPYVVLPHHEGWPAESPHVGYLLPPEKQKTAWAWPTEGHLTQGFSDHHQAYDIANEVGTDVVAAGDGVVAQIGHDSRHGINVLLDHAEGYQTFYSHLDDLTVAEGDLVSQGLRIGSMGQSGIATGPHLHFQIRWNGNLVNPAEYLPEINP